MQSTLFDHHDRPARAAHAGPVQPTKQSHAGSCCPGARTQRPWPEQSPLLHAVALAVTSKIIGPSRLRTYLLRAIMIPKWLFLPAVFRPFRAVFPGLGAGFLNLVGQKEGTAKKRGKNEQKWARNGLRRVGVGGNNYCAEQVLHPARAARPPRLVEGEVRGRGEDAVRKLHD